MAAARRRICIGVVTGARGVRGELRIRPLTENPQDVAAYGPVETEDGSRRFILSNVNIVSKSIVARVNGITTRDEAEALKGVRLYVPKEALPQIEEDEYYEADLVGLKVSKVDGVTLGELVAVQNFGAGDLLEIHLEDRKDTVLLPFTVDFVPEVDLDGGVIVIDPPDGLFDLPGETTVAENERE